MPYVLFTVLSLTKLAFKSTMAGVMRGPHISQRPLIRLPSPMLGTGLPLGGGHSVTTDGVGGPHVFSGSILGPEFEW